MKRKFLHLKYKYIIFQCGWHIEPYLQECNQEVERGQIGQIHATPNNIWPKKMLPLIKNWMGGGHNFDEKQDPILIMHMGGLGGPGLKMTRMSEAHLN